MILRFLGLVAFAALFCTLAAAQPATPRLAQMGREMIRAADAQGEFESLPADTVIMLRHRPSGLICNFEHDSSVREIAVTPTGARCRHIGLFGEEVLTAARSEQSLHEASAMLAEQLAAAGEPQAPPRRRTACSGEKAPHSTLRYARRDATSVEVITEAFVIVRGGWRYTFTVTGSPGNEPDLFAHATLCGLLGELAHYGPN